ncbi:DUF488 domain-containing protein [Inquilinus sp. CAU 1745]|uniref:DUF488 domain-containing protein n=1 Tax=Inquilinus sp. CAU 1745 TaxID=3140369 RepID=UPI00325B4C4E
MTYPFFTIGHSTRPTPEFVDLLRPSGIRTVVDVRTMPRSRTNPQFNFDVLPESLRPFQIGYCHVRKLGGLRARRKGDAPSPNGLWRNTSFRNYADYALTEDFSDGLEELLGLGREGPCAIMCAEAVWWRCHRRIISDYLLAAGHEVFHIMGPEKVEPAKMTPGAEPQPDGGILYPPSTSGA